MLAGVRKLLAALEHVPLPGDGAGLVSVAVQELEELVEEAQVGDADRDLRPGTPPAEEQDDLSMRLEQPLDVEVQRRFGDSGGHVDLDRGEDVDNEASPEDEPAAKHVRFDDCGFFQEMEGCMDMDDVGLAAR
eukprot:587289-Karenia_brevis.AAC.1